MSGFSKPEGLLKELGKHKLVKPCLYINKLSDITMDIFEDIVRFSIITMQQKYACKSV
jgi:hypothetical protein